MADPVKFFSVLGALARSAPQKMMGEQWRRYLAPGRVLTREGVKFPLKKDELLYGAGKKLLDQLEPTQTYTPEFLHDLYMHAADTSAVGEGLNPTFESHGVGPTGLRHDMGYYNQYQLPGPKLGQAENLTLLPDSDYAAGSHFGSRPGLLSWNRTTDRNIAVPGSNLGVAGSTFDPVTGSKLGDAPRATHLEEVQSDWHQKARKEGYQEPITDEELAEKRALEAKYLSDPHNYTTQEADRHRFLYRKSKASVGPPRAPYSDSWPSLELRKALADAVDKDHDYLTWTTGQQQVDRYPGLDEGQRAGMLHSYDQDLPSRVRKLSQQYGGPDVGTVQLPDRRYNVPPSKFDAAQGQRTQDVHGLHLSPELKAKIRKTGLPLFSAGALSGLAATPPHEESDMSYARGGRVQHFAGGGQNTIAYPQQNITVHTDPDPSSLYGLGPSFQFLEYGTNAPPPPPPPPVVPPPTPGTGGNGGGQGTDTGGGGGGGTSNQGSNNAGNSTGSAGVAGDYAGHPGRDANGNLTGRGVADVSALLNGLSQDPTDPGFFTVPSWVDNLYRGVEAVAPWQLSLPMAALHTVAQGYNADVGDQVRAQQGIPDKDFWQWAGALAGVNPYGDVVNPLIANRDQFMGAVTGEVDPRTGESLYGTPTTDYAETLSGKPANYGPFGLFGTSGPNNLSYQQAHLVTNPTLAPRLFTVTGQNFTDALGLPLSQASRDANALKYDSDGALRSYMGTPISAGGINPDTGQTEYTPGEAAARAAAVHAASTTSAPVLNPKTDMGRGYAGSTNEVMGGGSNGGAGSMSPGGGSGRESGGADPGGAWGGADERGDHFAQGGRVDDLYADSHVRGHRVPRNPHDLYFPDEDWVVHFGGPDDTAGPVSSPSLPSLRKRSTFAGGGLVTQDASGHWHASPGLIGAIRGQESGGERDPNHAVSPAGAAGGMQVMPRTAAEVAAGLGMNDYDPTNEQQNTLIGSTYFNQMLDRYNGDVTKALQAYNAGPGRVDAGGALPQETQNYAPGVLARLGQVARPRAAGAQGSDFLNRTGLYGNIASNIAKSSIAFDQAVAQRMRGALGGGNAGGANQAGNVSNAQQVAAARAGHDVVSQEDLDRAGNAGGASNNSGSQGSGGNFGGVPSGFRMARGGFTRTKLDPDDELLFQRDMRFAPGYRDWYRSMIAAGEKPGVLDNPNYDTRGAWQAGTVPQIYPHDGRYHWDSVAEPSPPYARGKDLKAPDHPTHWMQTFMELYGVDPNDAPVSLLEDAMHRGITPNSRGVGGYAKGGLTSELTGKLGGASELGKMMQQLDADGADQLYRPTPPHRRPLPRLDQSVTEAPPALDLGPGDYQELPVGDVHALSKNLGSPVTLSAPTVADATPPPPAVGVTPPTNQVPGGPVDPTAYAQQVAALEGGAKGDAAVNPVTGAASRYQFMASTWNDLAKRYPDLKLPAFDKMNWRDKPTVDRAFNQLTSDNVAQLKTRYGKTDPAPADLYATHLLGASGGGRLLDALSRDPNAPVTRYVAPAAVAANRAVFYGKAGPLTVRQAYDRIQRSLAAGKWDLAA